MKKLFKGLAMLLAALMVFTTVPVKAADSFQEEKTGIKLSVYTEEWFQNWEGISNVSQFKGSNGSYWFAYYDEKAGDDVVHVIKTKGGVVQPGEVKLKLKYPYFGGITVDSKGYFYVVTGAMGDDESDKSKTVFITKYDKKGKAVKSVGDNGSLSLSKQYGTSFYTDKPFDSGNCEIAINGNLLSVYYSRHTYGGKQCDGIFTINKNTMKSVNVGSSYNTHSFAQRVISYKKGFVYMSEGDIQNRAFTMSKYNGSSKTLKTADVFHFWAEPNLYDKNSFAALANNYAHLGNIVNISNKKVALVGTSAKSLNSKAKSQIEQLFIQIFDPDAKLSSKSAYTTKGERKGKSGKNGDENVTDYGVQWLTSYTKGYRIMNPQAVITKKGKIVILYELYKDRKFKSLDYMVLSKTGKVLSAPAKLSSTAMLNSDEMPVAIGESVYWTANRTDSKALYVYKLTIK